MVSLVFAGQAHRGFPPVVRRLNMLRPARYVRAGEEGPGFSTYVASWTTKADYLKDWVVFNLADEGGSDVDTATFGAFTTAPDATVDTARLLVETTANSQHSLIAGWNAVNQWSYGKIRLAGIFKAATRQRVVLTMTSQGSGSSKFGCKAVFDVLNGRVAVDTTAFGSPVTPWTLYPAKVYNAGSGFYLCIVDALVTLNQSGMAAGVFAKVSLDNGTGLAAESSTYAGDGSSGIYVWRANMLPTRAWNLGHVSFFDDFDDDTMANIDLTDSRAAGFDWYIHNDFPSYFDTAGSPLPATDPSKLSVANSVLTCSSHPVPLFMETAVSTWTHGDPLTSGYVGQGWVVPALFEARAKWDISLSNGADAATMWTNGLEWLVGGRSQDPTMASREYDFFEALHGNRPLSHMIYDAPGSSYVTSDQAQGSSSIGLDVWNAAHTYPIGSSVARLGTNYTSLLSNTNRAPESNPTEWGAYDQTALGQPGAIIPVGDYTNFHDYATLWLPYDPVTGEPGQVVEFYDGIMCSFTMTYGPGLSGNVQSSDFHQSDWQQMPVLLGCGPTMGISFDWVRVTQ